MKTNRLTSKTSILSALIILAAFNSCQAQTKNPSVIVTDQNALKVETKQVGQCSQAIPVGWLSDSPKEGNAIGLWDPANTMYAAYMIFPINTAMGPFYDKELYNKNPERSVIRVISMICGGQFKDGAYYYTNEINESINGYLLRSFASANHKGVVLYKIFPGDNINFSYIECLRYAVTTTDQWDQKGPMVMGIAASISCNTILVQHESPSVSLPRSSSLKSSASKSKKDDYGYNPQLGTEYCHNPNTGENFRVDPSIHWSETGPDGPGYYGKSGNSSIKMAPGRSN